MNYVICVSWGDQAILSVQRRCALCERTVALAADNAKFAKDARFLCLGCYEEHFEGTDFVAGGLVGGRLYDNVATALLAAKAQQGRN
jgi:hypothetical protein